MSEMWHKVAQNNVRNTGKEMVQVCSTKLHIATHTHTCINVAGVAPSVCLHS